VDLEMKAQMLTACGSFAAGTVPTRRWRDDPALCSSSEACERRRLCYGRERSGRRDVPIA
jgi:hypothetical protein